jgi:hypothetical protein
MVSRWRKDEEKHGFPFSIDQLFKLALAFTDNAFVVAVDGDVLFSYGYRGNNSFLESLTGVKVSVSNGLQLEVQGVDHLNTGMTDCDGFETYSHPDVVIN